MACNQKYIFATSVLVTFTLLTFAGTLLFLHFQQTYLRSRIPAEIETPKNLIVYPVKIPILWKDADVKVALAPTVTTYQVELSSYCNSMKTEEVPEDQWNLIQSGCDDLFQNLVRSPLERLCKDYLNTTTGQDDVTHFTRLAKPFLEHQDIIRRHVISRASWEKSLVNSTLSLLKEIFTKYQEVIESQQKEFSDGGGLTQTFIKTVLSDIFHPPPLDIGVTLKPMNVFIEKPADIENAPEILNIPTLLLRYDTNFKVLRPANGSELIHTVAKSPALNNSCLSIFKDIPENLVWSVKDGCVVDTNANISDNVAIISSDSLNHDCTKEDEPTPTLISHCPKHTSVDDTINTLLKDFHKNASFYGIACTHPKIEINGVEISCNDVLFLESDTQDFQTQVRFVTKQEDEKGIGQAGIAANISASMAINNAIYGHINDILYEQF